MYIKFIPSTIISISKKVKVTKQTAITPTYDTNFRIHPNAYTNTEYYPPVSQILIISMSGKKNFHFSHKTKVSTYYCVCITQTKHHTLPYFFGFMPIIPTKIISNKIQQKILWDFNKHFTIEKILNIYFFQVFCKKKKKHIFFANLPILIKWH